MYDRAYTCFPVFLTTLSFPKLAFLFFSICSLILPAPESSQAARLQVSPEQAKQLAQDPIWLKLLHCTDGQSEILTEDFFLSPNGRQAPAAELLATLNAYSEPWSAEDNNDTHARCRFPARYLWLSSHIPLPDYSPQPPQCRRLSRWSLPDQVSSISLFLVSGYLGNPASVFGHSLLKFNTDSADDQAGLFDLTVNYGALVPENESALLYIVNGIAGGYQAGFSDRYFYTQDLVYSRTEFRDIWDYQLRLSDKQQQLLIFHLWEILGKKFKYYFFHKNCAARLAELLEIILKEPLLKNASLWYAPVEIFHHLEKIDRSREKAGRKGLIQSVRFIPSVERTLCHRFDQLAPDEKKAVQNVMRKGTDVLQESLIQVNSKRRSVVLDTLLAYFNYRLVADEPAPDEKIRQEKKELLLARLRLPPRTMPLKKVPERESPAKGNPPLLTGLGIGNSHARNSYVRLRLSPFSQESVGRNSLGGDELTLLNTVAGIGEKGFFADSFDLIKIRKIKTDYIPADGNNPWSWKLHTGMESIEEDDTAEQDFFFRFGAGRARRFGSSTAAYALLEVSAHTEQPHARLFPRIGILTDFGRVKSRIYGGASLSYQDHLEAIYGIELQYDISGRSAFSLQGEKGKIAVELKRYW